MDQSLDKKTELKDAIQSFFNNNKKKFFLLISIVIAMTIALFVWKDNNQKKKYTNLRKIYKSST